MKNLAEKFLADDDENLEIYKTWKENKSERLRDVLNIKYKNFILKIFFTSYIKKQITYTALQIKKRSSRLNTKEKLMLNTTHVDFNEDYINVIADKIIDFAELVSQAQERYTFDDIISDPKILSAVNSLSTRQKEIIYMIYIENKKEVEVAKELNVSLQSINKTKNKALMKLQSKLRGEDFGNI